MKHRLVAAALTVVAALSFTSAAAVVTAPAAMASTWACAGAQGANIGVCVNDPVPHPLPVIVLPI